MRLEIAGRARADRRRLQVRRARHDRDARRDAARGGGSGQERAGDIFSRDKIRQLVPVKPGQPEQPLTIAESVESLPLRLGRPTVVLIHLASFPTP